MHAHITKTFSALADRIDFDEMEIKDHYAVFYLKKHKVFSIYETNIEQIIIDWKNYVKGVA